MRLCGLGLGLLLVGCVPAPPEPCPTPEDIETERVRLANRLRMAGHAERVDAHEAALAGEPPRRWPKGTSRWTAMKAAKAQVRGVLEAGGGGSFVSFDCDEDPCLVSVRGPVAKEGRDALIDALAARGWTVRPKGKASRFNKPETWLWTFPLHEGPTDVFDRARAEARIQKAHAEARHVVRPGKQGVP